MYFLNPAGLSQRNGTMKLVACLLKNKEGREYWIINADDADEEHPIHRKVEIPVPEELQVFLETLIICDDDDEGKYKILDVLFDQRWLLSNDHDAKATEYTWQEGPDGAAIVAKVQDSVKVDGLFPLLMETEQGDWFARFMDNEFTGPVMTTVAQILIAAGNKECKQAEETKPE